jgi:hypothetical protein
VTGGDPGVLLQLEGKKGGMDPTERRRGEWQCSPVMADDSGAWTKFSADGDSLIPSCGLVVFAHEMDKSQKLLLEIGQTEQSGFIGFGGSQGHYQLW